jgi:hypothetical protein
MNEIQIIRQQLETERMHFSELTSACAAALDAGRFEAAGELAAACADYFTFAAGRLRANLLRQSPPEPSASAGQWREFLRGFEQAASSHFALIDQFVARGPSVAEWRTISGIDADAIVAERTRYRRVKAALS